MIKRIADWYRSFPDWFIASYVVVVTFNSSADVVEWIVRVLR